MPKLTEGWSSGQSGGGQGTGQEWNGQPSRFLPPFNILHAATEVTF